MDDTILSISLLSLISIVIFVKCWFEIRGENRRKQFCEDFAKKLKTKNLKELQVKNIDDGKYEYFYGDTAKENPSALALGVCQDEEIKKDYDYMRDSHHWHHFSDILIKKDIILFKTEKIVSGVGWMKKVLKIDVVYLPKHGKKFIVTNGDWKNKVTKNDICNMF